LCEAGGSAIRRSLDRSQAPGRAVEVCAFDEHRAGLKLVVRRVWAKCGQRPAVSPPRCQWLYLYTFALADQPELLKATTRFYWWPEAA
jgi:hypothetical protein